MLRGGRLFQQYLVDAYTTIEEQRLKWTRNNQDTLRVDLYYNVCDAVTRGDTSATGLDKRIVLPMNFTGGPRNPAEIDDIISTELPSPIHDPNGYKVVTEYMLHGPCGQDAKKASCTIEGKCSKHFPKSFVPETETVIDADGYAIYCRRDNKVTAKKAKFVYENRHVVPYNMYLLLKYQAHINVEWCNRSKAIKYLFKYLNKGPGREIIVIQENVKAGPNGGTCRGFGSG
ncbi:helicase [Tanacetum coccineum]